MWKERIVVHRHQELGKMGHEEERKVGRGMWKEGIVVHRHQGVGKMGHEEELSVVTFFDF